MMTRQPRQSWLQTKTLELCMGLSRQALENTALYSFQVQENIPWQWEEINEDKVSKPVLPVLKMHLFPNTAGKNSLADTKTK